MTRSNQSGTNTQSTRNGVSGYGTSGDGTSGDGTSGDGRNGTSAYGNNSTLSGNAGTGDPSNQLGQLGILNSEVLVFGNLMIVGSNPNSTSGTGTNGIGSGSGTAGSGATGTAGTSTTGTSDSAQILQTQFGQSFRVMRVTDRQAVNAIRRVKRNLSSAASVRTQSNRVLNDLQYILKKTSDVGMNNRASSRSGSGAGSSLTGAGTGMGAAAGTSAAGSRGR